MPAHHNTSPVKRPKIVAPDNILVPAAGMGRRIKNAGPKPLIQLNSEHTILSRQLAILKYIYNSSTLYYVLGNEFEEVVKHIPEDVLIIENENYETTNVVRSIGMGLRAISGSCLIIYGDLVFSPSTFLDLDYSSSFIIYDSQHQFEADEVGLVHHNGYLSGLSYGLPEKWCHIVYLTGEELVLFKRLTQKRSNANLYGFEILNLLIEQDCKIRAVEPKGMKIQEVDDLKGLERARKI